jgi:exosortase A-associated hydrolase 1
MHVSEQARFFDCGGAALLGIVALPEPRAPIGAVIVVGGPQYRAGSHRQFVLLARALADAGIASIRFDYRGMGDAEGDALTFEAIDDDIRCAIDALQQETGVARIVLVGLCDGASAALRYCTRDDRIAGVVAMNPWARSTAGEAAAKLRYYYPRRLASAAFWRKLFAGAFDARTAARDVRSAAGAVASAPRTGDAAFRVQMHAGMREFGRPILVLLSGNDLTAREFEDWVAAERDRRKALQRRDVTVVHVADADHTFSQSAHRIRAERTIVEWFGRLGSCQSSQRDARA